MRVKRKPIIYDAQPAGDGSSWVVTNLLTKEKKVFTDKEFRMQFEQIRDERPTAPSKAKYEPPVYPPLDIQLDDETGQLQVWMKEGKNDAP
jgi:hypothetical protein